MVSVTRSVEAALAADSLADEDIVGQLQEILALSCGTSVRRALVREKVLCESSRVSVQFLLVSSNLAQQGSLLSLPGLQQLSQDGTFEKVEAQLEASLHQSLSAIAFRDNMKALIARTRAWMCSYNGQDRSELTENELSDAVRNPLQPLANIDIVDTMSMRAHVFMEALFITREWACSIIHDVLTQPIGQNDKHKSIESIPGGTAQRNGIEREDDNDETVTTHRLSRSKPGTNGEFSKGNSKENSFLAPFRSNYMYRFEERIQPILRFFSANAVDDGIHTHAKHFCQYSHN